MKVLKGEKGGGQESLLKKGTHTPRTPKLRNETGTIMVVSQRKGLRLKNVCQEEVKE